MSHILTVRAFYSCTYEGGLQYLYIPSVYFVFCNDAQWLFTILLHGQNGRFTVWANVNQNSRLVNFVPELCSPFVLTS